MSKSPRSMALIFEQFAKYIDNEPCDLTEDEFNLISQRLCEYYNRMTKVPLRLAKFQIQKKAQIILED